MGYAFEGDYLPESEQLGIAIMNAQIRDGFLNPQERWTRDQTCREIGDVVIVVRPMRKTGI